MFTNPFNKVKYFERFADEPVVSINAQVSIKTEVIDSVAFVSINISGEGTTDLSSIKSFLSSLTNNQQLHSIKINNVTTTSINRDKELYDILSLILGKSDVAPTNTNMKEFIYVPIVNTTDSNMMSKETLILVKELINSSPELETLEISLEIPNVEELVKGNVQKINTISSREAEQIIRTARKLELEVRRQEKTTESRKVTTNKQESTNFVSNVSAQILDERIGELKARENVFDTFSNGEDVKLIPISLKKISLHTVGEGNVNKLIELFKCKFNIETVFINNVLRVDTLCDSTTGTILKPISMIETENGKVKLSLRIKGDKKKLVDDLKVSVKTNDLQPDKFIIKITEYDDNGNIVSETTEPIEPVATTMAPVVTEPVATTMAPVATTMAPNSEQFENFSNTFVVSLESTDMNITPELLDTISTTALSINETESSSVAPIDTTANITPELAARHVSTSSELPLWARILIIVVILLLCVVGGYFWYRSLNEYSKPVKVSYTTNIPPVVNQ